MTKSNLDLLNQIPFLIHRKEIIKKHQKLLCKYESVDSLYLTMICNFTNIYINSDVNLLDYEKSIHENNYIETNYFEISKIFWLFADNIQGDQWFLHKLNNTVYYYDHDKGEYQINEFKSLNVSFLQFIQFSLLCRELENFSFPLSDEYKSEFIRKSNEIHENILEFYPYRLW